jgi:hypothetical protein
LSLTSSKEYIERFSRQLLLKDWSFSTQQKIRTAKVLVDIKSETLFWYGAAMGFEHLDFTHDTFMNSRLSSSLLTFNRDIKISKYSSENNYDFFITSAESFCKYEIMSRHRLTIEYKKNDLLKLLLESNGPVIAERYLTIPKYISLDDLLGPLINILISEFV